MPKNILALRFHIGAMPKNILARRFHIAAMPKNILALRFRIVALSKNIPALRFRIAALTKDTGTLYPEALKRTFRDFVGATFSLPLGCSTIFNTQNPSLPANRPSSAFL
jgi:hypothetical protein